MIRHSKARGANAGDAAGGTSGELNPKPMVSDHEAPPQSSRTFVGPAWPVAYDTCAGGYVTLADINRLQRPRFGRILRAGNVSARGARRAQERAGLKAVRR